MELRTNDKIELAREFILYTRSNIFLTGKAGTGKTTFLREIINQTAKRTVVAAPTGIAALNAGGVTLHSLFQLPFGPYLPGIKRSSKGNYSQKISKQKISLIRSIELLIIDEISMVRSDMLDAIDNTLRTVRRSSKPFGGVQLLMIGDVQQLAPICKDIEWDMLREHYSTPFFYGSQALAKTSYIMVEFDEIFRQSDSTFMELLNAVRENRITTQQLSQLNSRYIPNFDPSDKEDYITLTTHNHRANSINQNKLDALQSKSKFYKAKTQGSFPESAYPNDEELELKVGAQVLFIKNDISMPRQYYNGMLGNITELGEHFVKVLPKSSSDDKRPVVELTVNMMEWENLEYKIDAKSGEMEQSVKGTFKQLPLKCAWAITIHKSQGLSFDRAIIDASGSFAHGQVYVALSRCRTMEGLVLRSELSNWSIIGDSAVENFCRFVSDNQPTEELLIDHKRSSYIETLCDIFEFEALRTELWEVTNSMSGAINKAYPKESAQMMDLVIGFDKELGMVGKSFQNQLRRMVYESEAYEGDSQLQERLTKAAGYFSPKIESIETLLKSLIKIHSNSTSTQQRLSEHLNNAKAIVRLLVHALECCAKRFDLAEYNRSKSRLIAQVALDKEPKRESITEETKGAKVEKRVTMPKSIEHKELYQALCTWRLEESKRIEKPAFTIFSNKTLMAIESSLPRTEAELRALHGVGDDKLYNFGDQILNIVDDYCIENKID